MPAEVVSKGLPMATRTPSLGGLDRGEWGWTIFEFARAPAATIIFMFVFAPYFTRFVVGDTVKGVEYWGMANAIGAVLIACLAPVIGAVVDRMGRRKPWLILAVVLLAMAEGSLWFALPSGQGGLSWRTIVMVLALSAFLVEVTAMLHNAMLDTVAAPAQAGRLSGFGYAASNAGTLCALGAMLVFIVLPASGTILIPGMGIGQWLDAASHQHDRLAGPYAAAWLVLFTVPFALLTPDKPASGVPVFKAVTEGVAQLWETVRRARSMANIGRFLLARMIYNDAIIALQAYAAIYGASVFGWESSDILIFALMLATACALGGLIASRADGAIGSRGVIVYGNFAIGTMLILMVSCSQDQILFVPVTSLLRGTSLFALPASLPEMVFIIAFLVLGAVATMVLVSSRSLLVKLCPPGMATQFFGIYSLSGYATAFAGHALVAGVTAASNSLTLGIASLLLLLTIGLFLMREVREERAEPVVSPAIA